jgi:protein ImuA
MAASAVAQDTIAVLRRQIAAIEGRLAERLEEPVGQGVVVRAQGVTCRADADLVLPTGATALDRVLGGGLPQAGLTEIHTAETRDAGAAAGFALALAARALKTTQAPVLWVGTGEIFREAGLPYAPGLAEQFGILPENLLISQVPKLVDALWVAEEAAPLGVLSAVLIELRGNPGKLDLTATRRLHRRAQIAGRPVFLIREAAAAEPTAAPLRLVISAAPAAPRMTLAGAMEGSIGRPAFNLRITKNRASPEIQFLLEWNSHDLSFEERRPQDSGLVVPLSQRRADTPSAIGTVVAFGPAGARAADLQPARKQQPADRRRRRAG